ncbi:hypothetical protein CTEN210_11756 [Chaetoceros tenuissimus]|uniref:Uncharacterized protein n=1 Tax=Chaetoceros tenuissimus TaxID=426638 RepID=A0AAD3H9F2_9STRA|nr:hypothetical protein CTEN210_11756 [Chaetoceros tenuissimus]
MKLLFVALLTQLCFESATSQGSTSSSKGGVTLAPAPAPCSCGNAGVCTISPIDSTPWCICEDTFEVTYNSKGKPICTCPSDTLLNDMNRCIPITTDSPLKPPSPSPTQTSTTDSPTDLATNAPSAFTPNDDECKDHDSFTFTLSTNDNIVACEWITSNKNRINERKAKYCHRADVKGACQMSCDNCQCKDQNFSFALSNKNIVDCTYITKNWKKTAARRNKFCFTDIQCREASSIGNALPTSKVPTKNPSIVGPDVPAPSKGYGPPTVSGPSKGYGPPSVSVPSKGYGPPTVSVPSKGYGPPTVSVPSKGYGASGPSKGYGTSAPGPSKGYAGPTIA